MSRGVNKVILVGNLGQDPEIRFSKDGACIATLSIATDESYKDRQTDQVVPRTEWHRCVAGNRLGEICRDYLKKGSKVYIEGRLMTRKWQDQQGQDRYTTEIRVKELQMLDSKGDSNGQAPVQQPRQAPRQQPPQQGYPQNNQQPRQQAPAMAPAMDDFDDDIPF